MTHRKREGVSRQSSWCLDLLRPWPSSSQEMQEALLVGEAGNGQKDRRAVLACLERVNELLMSACPRTC